MVQGKKDTNSHFVGACSLLSAFTPLYWTMVKTKRGDMRQSRSNRTIPNPVLLRSGEKGVFSIPRLLSKRGKIRLTDSYPRRFDP